MKIALIGSRGIPARYSGFETFYEQLGVRLAARGHSVTVYNRRHFIRDVKGAYKGVRLVSLPCIRTKHLETLTHTLLSSLHALTQRYDIAYYCIVGNAPLVWLPRLAGSRTLLNVDGEDWAREKWGAFARWYQKVCERVATVTPSAVVADAVAIRDRYRREYGIETVFVPYGANIARTEATDALARFGLLPRRYVLYVGRFVPENAIHILLEAFRGVKTDMKLVVVGDAPYADDYKRQLRERADDRVVFTGYVFGEGYAELSSHAYLYVQPSAIDGTRPALLDQLGFGNAVLVRDSTVNMEVIGGEGAHFTGGTPVESLRERLQQLVDAPAEVEGLRRRAHARITDYYNWDTVTDFYEMLFARLLQRQPLESYDTFVAARPRPVLQPPTEGTVQP
jgi:glycosyltransferase involved in cell wall biosynthesis